MAHRDSAPNKPPNVGDISNMLSVLELHLKKGKGNLGFSCRKATFTLPNKQQVDSWKMQDWDYKKANLPTYARGLFTSKNSRGQPEIVVRGYDKFFNHGEVRKTEWENVERDTRGPYELSVKENGCIIFIAGLEDGSLIVCSKHSTGARDDVDISHAAAGERWVEKHLASVGKTKEQLARELRRMNATAIAELCDDNFEEHVLAYTPDQAGLYLHGINLNLPEFATYPGHLVDKFAEEWGFKKTMYKMMDDIREVKAFLDGVAETGAYNGRDTEGFVIRCQAREAGGEWYDWFFKYKFDEPYLMYRQWRECTKSVIRGHTPKIRKHKKITEEYLLYARRRLAADPKLGKAYNNNHGIISLRDDFLASRGTTGADIIRSELENGEGAPVTKNVVLVPIATIGCGKTTVAIALCKLFGWGHFQNDNVQGPKQRAARFAQSCVNELASHPVVVADRNNHQKREREQIIKDISEVLPTAIFVALHYVHDKNQYDTIRKATQERVLTRGDNHQTIQAGSKSREEIIGIMEGFLHRFQPCDTERAPDSDFDLVIDLDVTVSSRDNLETIVSRLDAEYPRMFEDMPTGSDLDAAIDYALNNYKPDLKIDLTGTFGKRKDNRDNRAGQDYSRGGDALNNGTQSHNRQDKQPRLQQTAPALKEPKLEYFSVKLNPQRVNAILEAIFRDAKPETAKVYRQLQQSRRIQPEFHVTLMHRASASQHPEQWSALQTLHSSIFTLAFNAAREAGVEGAPPEPELGVCQVQLERLVWDGRIMCFVVRLLNEEFKSTNDVAHVTVGTASQQIKPKESNDLLGRWLSEGSGGENGIWEEKVKGNVVLDGSVRGVLQRF
ncbi:tRNA ligase [Tothia fuscella]|uniref:tRNA ligase n=1 Tax=Tothia fuscella TaxID=1048955 RepID=A0A9P4TXL9_9PEZI|nr:tRNA ligase [Tothia fuscella]